MLTVADNALTTADSDYKQRWKQIKDYEFIYVYLYIEALYTVYSMQGMDKKIAPALSGAVVVEFD